MTAVAGERRRALNIEIQAGGWKLTGDTGSVGRDFSCLQLWRQIFFPRKGNEGNEAAG